MKVDGAQRLIYLQKKDNQKHINRRYYLQKYMLLEWESLPIPAYAPSIPIGHVTQTIREQIQLEGKSLRK
jgi:hypothetical protein